MSYPFITKGYIQQQRHKSYKAICDDWVHDSPFFYFATKVRRT